MNAVMAPRTNALHLARLLDGFAVVADHPVAGVTADSRAVEPGGLFIALADDPARRQAHVAEAVANGAAVVAYDPATGEPPEVDDSVRVVAVAELRRRAGLIAARALGDPAGDLEIVGITGTNGKSTCAWMLAQCLNGPVALVGTLGYGLWGELRPASHTTPDAVTLQHQLADYRERGARAVAMEVSSHALTQERMGGTRVDVAVFTNISRDHLDYHGDMAAYTAAKARLFAQPGLRTAVINADDPACEQMVSVVEPGCRVIRYSVENDAEVRLLKSTLHPRGQWLEVATPWGTITTDLPLLGPFNGANALAVIATLGAVDLDATSIGERLAALVPPPGRMDPVPSPHGPRVVVDYAHTPAALEAALRAVRHHAEGGRVWCVFGCGGDRDEGKRPEMGAIAERLADGVVLTNDNPRHEDPLSIIEQISAGMTRPEGVRVIPDRGEAIAKVVAEVEPQDWVLIAGKGHETTQQVGDECRSFADHEVARSALARREGRHDA